MEERATAEKIKRYAQVCFDEKGYEATTLREIAKLVGINAASLYYYYPSKEALYLDLLKDCQQMQRALMHTLLADSHSTTFEAKLAYVYKGMVRHYFDNQMRFRFILRNEFFPPAKLQNLIREELLWQDQLLSMLYSVFEQDMSIEASSAGFISQLIESFIIFQTGYLLHWTNQEKLPTEEEIENSWILYWEGIKNRYPINDKGITSNTSY